MESLNYPVVLVTGDSRESIRERAASNGDIGECFPRLRVSVTVGCRSSLMKSLSYCGSAQSVLIKGTATQLLFSYEPQGGKRKPVGV